MPKLCVKLIIHLITLLLFIIISFATAFNVTVLLIWIIFCFPTTFFIWGFVETSMRVLSLMLFSTLIVYFLFFGFPFFVYAGILPLTFLLGFLGKKTDELEKEMNHERNKSKRKRHC